jgi:hypothetical protein
MFHLITCNVACLVIAAVFYTYRDVYLRRRRSMVHHRVAYMLWVAAGRAM